MDTRDIYTWAAITVVVLASTAGDVLIAQAMQKIGDVSELRRRAGISAVISAVANSGRFMLAIFFMAISFFTLMIALSWADVSLVVPASAACTFLSNAIAAKIFLYEKVDRRRWIAALFVAAGVALLAQ
jgi:drug/metabolite transporter (DMT)-like permease